MRSYQALFDTLQKVAIILSHVLYKEHSGRRCSSGTMIWAASGASEIFRLPIYMQLHGYVRLHTFFPQPEISFPISCA